MIEYRTSTSKQELQEILDLQQLNLSKNISLDESKAQGFVTVEHDFDTLNAMNHPYPHIIAKVDKKVVAYALVMQQSFKDRVPLLIPMFDLINDLSWKGRSLTDWNYFVMGQVCIAKEWRAKGIFGGLYNQMKESMSPHFECIITEVATRNTRSMRAHEKVGFEVLNIYKTDKEEWAVVGWDWS